MTSLRIALLAGATFAAVPAAAQTSPAPAPAAPAQTAPAAPAAGQTTAPAAPATGGAATVGATVYDTAGGTIGTVEQVTADAALINTGTNKVAVPLTSVGKGAKGATMAMTKAQLDAAAVQQQSQAKAQLDAQLVAGTQVHGLNGTPVGTIKTADPQFVTLTTAKGGEVKLPRTGFSTGPSGVIIGMTAQQFDAAVAGAGGAPAATPPAK